MPCASLGTLHGRLAGSGLRVTSCPLLHPSGASKVTASGSHQSRLTARTVAGAPGPTSGHVHGPAAAECDLVAETVTIPCEYAWLGGRGSGPLSLGLRGLEGKALGGRAQERRTPAGGVCCNGFTIRFVSGGGHSHLGLTSPIGSDI